MSIREEIEQMIKDNNVILFMKGTKDMPQCGFSAATVECLNRLGVPFKDVNVLADMNVREEIKTYSNWPTIPQLYIKGEFIGGSDIVREMFSNGELKTKMQTAGLL